MRHGGLGCCNPCLHFPDGGGSVKAGCGQLAASRSPTAASDGAGLRLLQDGAAHPFLAAWALPRPEPDSLVPTAAR